MKNKKPKVRYSKSPPPGWPTEAEWVKIEKRMARSRPSLVWPPDSGPLVLAKSEVCAQFVVFLREENISQRALAKILDVTESRVSEVVHYHHARFTLDYLVGLLSKIRPSLRIKIA